MSGQTSAEPDHRPQVGAGADLQSHKTALGLESGAVEMGPVWSDLLTQLGLIRITTDWGEI